MAEEGNGTRDTIGSLAAQVRLLDRDNVTITRALEDLETKFERGLAALGTKLDQRSTTQWPTLIAAFAVTVTILGGLITILYGPIQRDTGRLDSAVTAIIDRGVFQREYAADQTRLAEALRGLRTDGSTNIQQQRYNADQVRLTHALDEMRSNIENMRTRSYDHLGRIAKTEQGMTDLERRFDAISNRLSQHIRDAPDRRP